MPTTIRLTADRGVTTITLDRAKIHNAFSPDMIAELTHAFADLGVDSEVRAIVLTGDGKSFSAGADLNWMKSMAQYSDADNVADAKRLDGMFAAMLDCPKPIVGRINGSAFGGGLGLVACCDITIAVDTAKFAFTEVNLGVVPAVIAPYVVRKTGVAPLTELFLTGERFDAQRAQHIGLLHHLVAPANLDGVTNRTVATLLTSAPGAVAAAKRLINTVAETPIEQVRDYTAQLIAHLRAGEEGQEGMAAFLEKRPPGWAPR